MNADRAGWRSSPHSNAKASMAVTQPAPPGAAVTQGGPEFLPVPPLRARRVATGRTTKALPCKARGHPSARRGHEHLSCKRTALADAKGHGCRAPPWFRSRPPHTPASRPSRDGGRALMFDAQGAALTDAGSWPPGVRHITAVPLTSRPGGAVAARPTRGRAPSPQCPRQPGPTGRTPCRSGTSRPPVAGYKRENPTSRH